MRVTVCQIEASSESLPGTLTALADHARAHSSDFALLPEMPFFEWLAAERRPDPRRWAEAVAAHDDWIAA